MLDKWQALYEMANKLKEYSPWECLSQVIEVAIRFRENKSILDGDEDEFLVRCLKTGSDGPAWMDAYLVPQSFTMELTGYRL